MRPAAIVLLVLILATAAGLPLWRHYTRPRDISVCVLTDLSFRQRPDWEEVVRSRFQEATRIYDKSVGIRWHVVSMEQSDPTAENRDLNARRFELASVPKADCAADLVVSITGDPQGRDGGKILPFSHAALVQDFPKLPESQNNLILARELAYLFGVPPDGENGPIMADPPHGEDFSPRAEKLIHRLRFYDFSTGVEALTNGWGSTVVSALSKAVAGSDPEPVARAHRVIAASLQGERHYAAAITELREAVKIDPGNALARYDLGLTLLQDTQNEAALGELRLAAELGPKYPQVHAALAQALTRTAPTEAAAEYQKAIQLQPNDLQLRLALGSLIVSAGGQADQAVAVLEQAIRLAPDSVEARQGLAQALIYREQSQADLTKDEQRAGRGSEDAQAHLDLAMGYERMGNRVGAVREFKKALTINPRFGAAHGRLAIAEYDEGNYQAAWQEIKAARNSGYEPPADFLRALSRKMPQ